MKKTFKEAEISKDELNSILAEMNKATDATPLAYILGREFCGVLFYLLSGSVRSLVFRRLLETLIKTLDETDSKGDFSIFLGRCMEIRVSDIFSEGELDNYFHARVSKEMDIDKMEE